MRHHKNYIKNFYIFESVLKIRSISIVANKESLDFFKETHSEATPYEIEVYRDSKEPFRLIDSDKQELERMRSGARRIFHEFHFTPREKFNPFMYDIINGIPAEKAIIHRYLNNRNSFDFDEFLCLRYFIDYHTRSIKDPQNKHLREFKFHLAILKSILP